MEYTSDLHIGSTGAHRDEYCPSERKAFIGDRFAVGPKARLSMQVAPNGALVRTRLPLTLH